MRKVFLLAALFAIVSTLGYAQADRFWSANQSAGSITKIKAVTRQSFPSQFKLFNLSIDPLRQDLMSVTNNSQRHSTTISLPNADGKLEQFEVYEASNFEPALQAQFPQIRAFSGRGLTDRGATLKLSLSPQGIQTMIFRTEKENEFIEPYSQDRSVYVVYKSQRRPGQLPWTCSTEDRDFMGSINRQLSNTVIARSTGDLKTIRLAQSVTAEYSNYFGATSSAQVALVLAAINATLTRSNGVYEKDLALHLNLIANTTNVIYYNAATDPYSAAGPGSGGAWNGELQTTLTSVIGEANYDIGHLFGASGGGGNAGCIGCICVNGSKGSGFTSPNDAIPEGDNFDIDYVVHEVGHQLGANHTYSHVNEGTGVNKEVGSGITIMGYAGITSFDVAPHSIDIFHQASIAQIQSNLTGKSCPITTSLAGNNATPVVAAVSNYTIPISTPFALTGSATDANAGDVLTYCWEQNNNSTTTGSGSVASATKATGPNWLSFSPTTSPVRLFPRLSTILAGGLITGPLPGGDAGANIEALSSVSRTLNFRLTVRDNCPYSSTAPIKVGQTQFTDMIVTVSNTSGPFAITAPNTAVTWAGGSSQTVTWNVTNTTAAPVSCANVKISLSTDGGNTFPTVLLASTPNDGTEAVTVPNSPTSTARIKVEAVGNIFFDIGNANFTISGVTCANPSGLTSSSITSTSATVGWSTVSGAISYDVDYKLASTGTWTNAVTATTLLNRNISGLNPGTLYDWRVRANCTGSSSTYTVAQFTTTCTNPAGLTSSAITNSGATLGWTAVTGAINYSVDYKAASSGTWLVLTASTAATTINISGLNSGTLYDWRVRTNCTSGVSINSTAQFTTTCGNPSGLVTSAVTATSATLSWAGIAGALNYSVDYKAATSGTWLVVTASTTALTVNLSGLSGGILYDWRVRTNCSVGTSINSTAQFTSSCGNPGSLSASAIGNTSATLSWSVVSGALNYTVEYKAASSGTWLNAGTPSATTLNLGSLTQGTLYDWRVRANCTSVNGVFIASQFTTTTPAPCGPVTGLSSSAVTTTSATITWTAVSGGLNYDVDYKAASSGTWINAATAQVSNSVNLSGLSAGTVYDWRVRAHCSELSSGYSTAQFTTNAAPGICNPVSGLLSSSITNASAQVSWNVLPGADTYDVSYKAASSGTWITVAIAQSGIFKVISGLSSSVLYDWRVRANCPSSSGVYTQAQFTTSGIIAVCDCPALRNK